MARLLLLASIITSNASPGSGQIGAFYFEALNQSQVWINIEPQSLEPGPNPLRLNVTVSFPGRSLSSAPSSVDVRVQDDCAVFPTRVRLPGFALIHDGLELRAGARGLPILFSSVCGDESGMFHTEKESLRTNGILSSTPTNSTCSRKCAHGGRTVLQSVKSPGGSTTTVIEPVAGTGGTTRASCSCSTHTRAISRDGDDDFLKRSGLPRKIF